MVNGEFFDKEQKSRTYVDKFVNKNNFFLIERYYRQNKSIPQLRRMIVRIKNHLHSSCGRYASAVYSSCDEERIKNTQVLGHGNSKGNVSLKQPYIRTNKPILSGEDELLRSKKRPAEVYDILLKESGGRFQSRSLPSDPQDTKQILNRQVMLQEKEKKNSECKNSTNMLEENILPQRNPHNLVRTVTINDNSYIAFAYTRKQVNDIKSFC